MTLPEHKSGPPHEGNTFAGSASQEHPGGEPGARKEVGTAASSQRNPPHVDQNADEAPVQTGHGNAAEIPTLPANASGRDRVTTGEQNQGIDEESMYDRRPSQDKDRPPSGNAEP